MDTIFALATVPGRSGVAIVRISGPDAQSACLALCGSIPASRGVRKLIDPATGEVIDEALVLYFPEGKSFTGEEVIELQIHGSPAITAKLLSVLSDQPSLRLAEAGDFTRRALHNGRLDLAEVEGLADLIDAETETQHRQAMRVFSGELGQLASSWRERLVRAAALIEATIDFADEDIPEDVLPEVKSLLTGLVNELTVQVSGYRAAERIRNGFEIAIVGRPNVGKSTLLNHLAGRKAALISDIPGTTRDVIEVRMNLGGHAVTLLDTAGIRTSDDRIEMMGVELAQERAKLADLRVFLIEGGDQPILPVQDHDIVATSKSDLAKTGALPISALTGDGIDGLLDQITSSLDKLTAGAGLAIRERHRVAMIESLDAIKNVKTAISMDEPLDIVADDLRYAASRISSIVGNVDVEDLLDEIFRSFCIGK